MAVSLKHAFTSSIPDDTDTSLVRPSNWNAEHNLTLAASSLLGRATASAGAAEEISVGTGLTLDATGKTLSVTTNTYQPLDGDLTSIAGLAGTTGFLTKTAANTWALDTSTYLTTTSASSTYQPLDGDLTSIAGLSGTTGFLTKTAANTWVLDTNTYLTTSSASTTYQPLDGDLTSIAGLAGTSGFLQKTAANTWSLNTSTFLTSNQTITLSGDVSGSGSTAITTAIGSNKVTNAMLAQVATATFKGRTSASTGNVEDLTATQATALLDTFTSTTKGLAPLSGGGTTNFLRADGTWAAPSASSGVSSISFGSTGLTPSTATTGAVTVAGTLAVGFGGTGATTAGGAFAALSGYTTTATANGTTALSNSSTLVQYFTGTSNQTVTLPAVTGLALGWEFRIINESTGTLTVNSSGGNLVVSIPAGIGATVTCILTTGTTAASWTHSFNDFNTSTMPVALGGTGAATFTSGALLKGAGTSAITTATAGTDYLGVPASSAQGDILIRDATGWTRLAAGTSGNYLKTNGTGANPSWAAVSSSGGMTLLGTLTTTSGSSLSLSSLTLTSYKEVVLVFDGVSASGTASYLVGTSTADDVQVTISSAAAALVYGMVIINLVNGTTFGNAAANTVENGVYTTDTTITTASTTINVAPSAGNFDAGSISIYGRA